MSPTSTTGRSAASAKPILAMSLGAQVDFGRDCPHPRPAPGPPRVRVRKALEHRAAAGSASAPHSRAPASSRARLPWTTSCAPISVCGFSSTGFMWTDGGTPQARACSAWARPISPPSAVTAALLLMFCGLNGRTRKPPPRERAAEPRHQQRLADVRPGALQHQGRRPAQYSMPSCALTPERNGCLTRVISVTRSAASRSSGLALRPVTTT